jgi:exopolysaccharide production protein ExoZ
MATTHTQDDISPASRRTNSHSTLKSLQILRAVAATGVVYFHIGAVPLFGSFGVDIFFVISGFVMAMVVENGQSPRVFAVSRLTRIAPLYWTLTTCLLILAAISPQLLNSTTFNLTNYIKSICFIPYFKESGQLQPILAVGWTLNYEMFFYFCIWLSIIVSRRLYIPLTFALLAAAYIVLGELSTNSVLQNFFGSSLLFEFALGILAYRIHKSRVLIRLGSATLLVISLLSFIFMAVAETLHFGTARIITYGIPSIALVLSITALEDTSILMNNPIVSVIAVIGDGSYATYLSHYYVVEGIRKIGFQKLHLVNPYTPIGVVFIVGTSLAVGHAIYTMCDKPLSTYFKRKLLSRSRI